MYPAYEQLGKDVQLGFARWRVYMHLQPPRLSHAVPFQVKVWAVQAALHMSPNRVVDALDWLTQRGYLVEHCRDSRKVRSLTLAWACAPSAPHPDDHVASYADTYQKDKRSPAA